MLLFPEHAGSVNDLRNTLFLTRCVIAQINAFLND